MSGRMLHQALEIKTIYIDWFKRMTGYGFEKEQDFIMVSQKRVTNNPRNTFTEEIGHIIKLDMAKEISMILNNKGTLNKYIISLIIKILML